MPRKKKNKPAEIDMQEVGVTGLKFSQGQIEEDPLNLLRGEKKYKYYREMTLNDPYVGAMLKLIMSLAAKSEWNVKTKGTSEKDIFYKEWLYKKIFTEMEHSFESFVKYVVGVMFRDGHGLTEIVLDKKKDGYFGIKKLARRGAVAKDKWDLTRQGEVKGIWQLNPNTQERDIYITYSKLLHFKIEDIDGSPEGGSLLRNCFPSYYVKKNISNLESIRVEKDCRGLRVMRAPKEYCVPNSKSKEVQAFYNSAIQALNNIGNSGKNSSLLFPSNPGFEFDILPMNGQITQDTNIIIERCNRDMTISMLSDFVLLGHKNASSGNISTTKVKIFSYFISSLFDEIINQFNKRLIPYLFEINNFNDYEYLPELSHTNLKELDEMSMLLYLQSVGKSGLMTPTVARDNYTTKKILGQDCPDVTEKEFEEYHANNDKNTLNDTSDSTNTNNMENK